GDVGEIKACLLILHEAGVEIAASLVSGIGAGNGESARKSRIPARCRRTHRGLDGTVQAASSLKQESSVPVLREREGESNAVGRARRGSAAIDHAIETTVRGQR